MKHKNISSEQIYRMVENITRSAINEFYSSNPNLHRYRRDTEPSPSHKPNEYGKIVVTAKKDKSLNLTVDPETKRLTKTIIYKFFVYNISVPDMEKIIEVITNNSKHVTNQITHNSSKGEERLIISVNPDRLDEWLDHDVPLIQKVLYQNKEYNQEEVSHLSDVFATRARDFFSNDAEKNEVSNNQNQSAINQWKHYLSTINDPETRKILSLYTQIYDSLGNEKVFGHILSMRNVQSILATNNKATFLLTPKEWLKFGRGVRRNAQPYAISIPKNIAGKPSEEQINQTKKETGWGGESYSSLPLQPKKEVGIRATANQINGFNVIYEYDISDTYLINKANDTFNNTVGLSNNLTGELNSLAKAAKEESSKDKDEKLNNINGSSVMSERTKLADEKIIEFMKSKNIDYAHNENNYSIDLSNALFSWYKILAEKEGHILKESNIETYASNATQITLIMTQLALDTIGKYTHSIEYTEEEASAIFNMVCPMADKLAKFSTIAEDTNSSLKNKFMNALNQLGITIIHGEENTNTENEY